MRKKSIAQRSLFDQAIDTLISVFKPNKQLKAMDAIINDNPDLAKVIHADLTKDCKGSVDIDYDLNGKTITLYVEGIIYADIFIHPNNDKTPKYAETKRVDARIRLFYVFDHNGDEISLSFQKLG